MTQPRRDRAEYMRDYRKRQREKAEIGTQPKLIISGTITPIEGQPVPFRGTNLEVIHQLSNRIIELEAMLVRAKRQLALRPAATTTFTTTKTIPVERLLAETLPEVVELRRDAYGDFRPVPKPGGKK